MYMFLCFTKLSVSDLFGWKWGRVTLNVEVNSVILARLCLAYTVSGYQNMTVFLWSLHTKAVLFWLLRVRLASLYIVQSFLTLSARLPVPLFALPSCLRCPAAWQTSRQSWVWGAKRETSSHGSSKEPRSSSRKLWLIWKNSVSTLTNHDKWYWNIGWL